MQALDELTSNSKEQLYLTSTGAPAIVHAVFVSDE